MRFCTFYIIYALLFHFESILNGNKFFPLALPSLGLIENRPPLAVSRPKCNSILHLFGEWLFEAAHIGGDTWLQHTKSLLNFEKF